ncbi:MAG: type B 50S ribosomal protein L31 [Bacteriovoracales bacterium]|nr:type B 50S ribosomal protein L31 [Bacteriovoracales bacterium]
MKKDIHPDYRHVIFKDVSTGFAVLTRSTLEKVSESMTWEDGKDYPVYLADISSSSHPFYTGTQRILDSEGRVEKFKKKYKSMASLKKKKS